jgi:FixJ family two-component response regulator
MKKGMKNQREGASIGILDDDESVRAAIDSLMRSAGYRTALFASTEAFLHSDQVHKIDCLVIDFHMRGLSGLELQRRLVDEKYPAPIIVVSAHDGDLRETALKQGAVAVFGKPFSDEALLAAIRSALGSSGR